MFILKRHIWGMSPMKMCMITNRRILYYILKVCVGVCNYYMYYESS